MIKISNSILKLRKRGFRKGMEAVLGERYDLGLLTQNQMFIVMQQPKLIYKPFVNPVAHGCLKVSVPFSI